MYVRNSVWESGAQPIDRIFSSHADIRSSLENLGFLGDPSSALTSSPEPTDPLTTIRHVVLHLTRVT